MILDLFLTYLPLLIAMLAECGIVKWAIAAISKAKETNELKAVVAQNKTLVQELREAKKLNKELLTKIDRIQREEE